MQFLGGCLAALPLISVVAAAPKSQQDYLTDDTIGQILKKRLPKKADQSAFLFAPTVVTEDHSLDVTYDLEGPDNCKVFPGDAQWPAQSLWANLKLATDGGLMQPVPMSHVCYANGTGSVDEDACQSLAENWNSARFIDDLPIDVMSPSQVGLTCQPSSLFDTEGCTQGGYPVYTVNATSVSQIQLAVNFARNTGIRFVIQNTGHDFLGKSSGAGSLSVWTHGMKDMEFIPSYEGCGWSGAAIKAGAGAQTYEIAEFADQHGVTSLGGLCVTVGAVGGWFQGGGHSPLSPLFGMGADQVLSIDVVTSDGRFVTASADENADLFWAMRGGGAGTWGVVTAVTAKAHDPVHAATATWSFSYPSNVTEDTFKQAMYSWLSYFPRYADMGLYSYLNTVPAADGGRTFLMDPLVAPNKTIAEAQEIIQPWLDDIKDLGIELQPAWEFYDTWLGVSQNALTNGSANNYGTVSGNRLFPRANFEDADLFNQTFDAIWENVQAGYVVLPYNIAPTYERGGRPDDAINPAWRETIAYVIMGTSVDYTMPAEEIMETRYNFTNGPMQKFRDVSPGAGSYGNEADRLEPNFQWAFYGSFYPRLLELKKRFDPFNVFYAITGVGSEFYEVHSIDNVSNENGPLCRKSNPDLYTAEGPDWEPPAES